MSKSAPAVAVLVFQGQGPAFRALHLAAVEPSLEVLEIIPLGDQAQVLIKGPQATLTQWLLRKDPGVSTQTFIRDWDQRIERAFYSLDLQPARASLLFVEGASLGEVFQAAADGLREGMEIVDLKIPRGSVKWASVVLTADKIPESFLTSLSDRGLQITPVADAAPALRRYFDIEP